MQSMKQKRIMEALWNDVELRTRARLILRPGLPSQTVLYVQSSADMIRQQIARSPFFADARDALESQSGRLDRNVKLLLDADGHDAVLNELPMRHNSSQHQGCQPTRAELLA
jgi:hypothetical protein